MESEFLGKFIFGVFIFVIVGVIIGVITLVITWGIKSSDYSSWTREYNGCYVHEVHHNYFWDHADYRTKTLLCPAGVTVK